MIRPLTIFFGASLLAQVLFSQTPDPAKEAQRANELVTKGQLEEAIPIYERLVRAFPTNPGLLLNLCIAEFNAGRYQNAVQHARAALKLKPDLAPANLFLGASYLGLGQHADALEPLHKALDAMPNDANARFMLAEALLESKRYEEALTEFRKSCDLLPDNPKVWYGLGQVYDALSERARRDLQTTSPDSVYWWALAGDSYLRQRRFGNAFAAYREALARGPAIPGIHAGLALIYKETGHAQWAAQEEALEAAVPRLDPASTGPAATYLSCKSYRDLAAQAYDRLPQLPPSLESHLHAAKTLDADGLHRDAVAEWRKALELAPRNLEVQMGLAWSLYEIRDFDSLLPVLKSVLEENPDSTRGMFLYGASLLNLEQPDAAIPYLEAALRGDPQMREAHAALGQALLRAGKPEQAIPHLKISIASDEDGNAHFQLFRAYQLTGNQQLAAQALEEYQKLRASLQKTKEVEEGSLITGPGK
jgi:tetratricopeptide (TPR) repeat protein